jgi:hypothetical protein
MCGVRCAVCGASATKIMILFHIYSILKVKKSFILAVLPLRFPLNAASDFLFFDPMAFMTSSLSLQPNCMQNVFYWCKGTKIINRWQVGFFPNG